MNSKRNPIASSLIGVKRGQVGIAEQEEGVEMMENNLQKPLMR